MDAINTQATQQSGSDSTKVKKTKRVIEKLSLEEIEGLEGAIAAPEKKIEQDQYFIQFFLKVSGLIGILEDVTQAHSFATLLDTKAKAKSVGSVISIGVENGFCQVVLKITTTGQQAKHSVPIKHAFAQLKEYLDTAQLLHQGTASWKAKVNGTTVAFGEYK